VREEEGRQLMQAFFRSRRSPTRGSESTKPADNGDGVVCAAEPEIISKEE
jgi:hypothetical protein